MPVRNLVQIGDPVIRAKAKKVLAKDKAKTKKLIRDMVDTMRATSLIGLAAPQIGQGVQVFCIEIKPTAQRKTVDQASPFTIFINPRIISRSKKETVLIEGCGSVGYIDSRIFGPVKRSAEVEVTALDENFQPFRLRAKGLLAKCIQHEYDHMQGIVVLDRFTDTRKCFVRAKSKK